MLVGFLGGWVGVRGMRVISPFGFLSFRLSLYVADINASSGRGSPGGPVQDRAGVGRGVISACRFPPRVVFISDELNGISEKHPPHTHIVLAKYLITPFQEDWGTPGFKKKPRQRSYSPPIA